ncbi:hypothetical protein PsorP6_006109 [Peronosclerospora sorghi]|uniref:Uncharacterized protein n=1 Tax=Peronosclerospora sorghi TaxID=230839 RepID=A0ACC0W3Y8_9STRA|nr:hypothetical protein PsorP6_006109 [Peronosclerospora sorghi]
MSKNIRENRLYHVITKDLCSGFSYFHEENAYKQDPDLTKSHVCFNKEISLAGRLRAHAGWRVAKCKQMKSMTVPDLYTVWGTKRIQHSFLQYESRIVVLKLVLEGRPNSEASKAVTLTPRFRSLWIKVQHDQDPVRLLGRMQMIMAEDGTLKTMALKRVHEKKWEKRKRKCEEQNIRRANRRVGSLIDFILRRKKACVDGDAGSIRSMNECN